MLSIALPEDVLQKAAELAAKDRMSVEEFFQQRSRSTLRDVSNSSSGQIRPIRNDSEPLSITCQTWNPTRPTVCDRLRLLGQLTVFAVGPYRAAAAAHRRGSRDKALSTC